MKTMCRRLFAAVLAAALVLTILPVTSVEAAAKPKLSQTKGILFVGEKGKLTVKNAPKKAKLTWASSKKSVATVSGKGVVKAKKVGSAKITCKVTVGKKSNTLTCKVTVKKKLEISSVDHWGENDTDMNSLCGIRVNFQKDLPDGLIKESNVTVTDGNDKKIKLKSVYQGDDHKSIVIEFDTIALGKEAVFNIQISGVKDYAIRKGVLTESKISSGETVEQLLKFWVFGDVEKLLVM